MEDIQVKHLKGAAFLLKKTKEAQVFISDEFGEEQQMIRDTMVDFIDNRVLTQVPNIEKQVPEIVPALMEEMGELGLLGSNMPEQYGGMDMDFISNSIIGEMIGYAGSFSVAYNAHVGIGMLPIYYFGTEAQKQKYLPKLATGEWKASYCLTEPSSGSDALAAKTKAVLSEDGEHYILNGQKMWITNAGFADVFTVFAKIDGSQFTGFLIDKGTPGLTLGEEEKKLGIKGSSTRMVFLENVKVPKSHILGEIGKGHLIAFNTLNIGRYKLGLSCLGGAKKVCEKSIQFANEREQFGQAISNFGAIKQKLATQATKVFATDAVTYRIAQMMDAEIKDRLEKGTAPYLAKLEAAEELALECSILKVYGSEILDYVVDENVQIHGGMGFSEEGTAARAYRDSRINRIFEGTNEINRMLLVNIFYKKVLKGHLDLATAAMKVQSELQEGIEEDFSNYTFPLERKAVSDFKSLCVMFLGFVGQLSMAKEIELKEEQEILFYLADMIIDIFALESTLLRVEKLSTSHKGPYQEAYKAMLKTLTQETSHQMVRNARDLTSIAVDDSMKGMFVTAIKKLTKYPLQNIKINNRLIADVLIEKNTYSF